MSNQIKVELQEVMGNDRSVAESAWTSSTLYQNKKQRTDADVKKIISMLAENKHSVPFESVIFRFWMKIPIVIDRQIVTHRIASHSGMSGRYRTMPNEFLEVPQDIQNILNSVNMSEKIMQYMDHCEIANNWYQNILDRLKFLEKETLISNNKYKRAREFFRGVLPQNNMTERVSIMNLRSWANFYKLRSSKSAQPEIQYIANEMLRLIKESGKCPETIEALEKNGWNI